MKLNHGREVEITVWKSATQLNTYVVRWGKEKTSGSIIGYIEIYKRYGETSDGFDAQDSETGICRSFLTLEDACRWLANFTFQSTDETDEDQLVETF